MSCILTIRFPIFDDEFEHFIRIPRLLLPFQVDRSAANHGGFQTLRAQWWFLNEQLHQLLIPPIHVTCLTEICTAIGSVDVSNLQFRLHSIRSNVLLDVDAIVRGWIHFRLGAAYPRHTYWLIAVYVTVERGRVAFFHSYQTRRCREVGGGWKKYGSC